jgi:hypothetical protein
VQSERVVFLAVQNIGKGFTGIIEMLATDYQHQTNMPLQKLAIPCAVLFNKKHTTIQGGIHVYQHIRQAGRSTHQ